MSLIDAQYFWFGHEKVTYSMLEQTNFAFSVQEFEGKRAARTVLTGMCYSVGSATRQGSSSPTRFIGQSAMTSRT